MRHRNNSTSGQLPLFPKDMPFIPKDHLQYNKLFVELKTCFISQGNKNKDFGPTFQRHLLAFKR